MPVDDPHIHEHLSRISTMWTVVFQAHRDTCAEAASARELLLERYCGAIFRYLLRAVRDPHLAEELSQEFALNFVRGQFRHADPDKGRFRDYVKTALFNLIRKHHRRENREPVALDLDAVEPKAPEEVGWSDDDFVRGWRDTLLAQAWDGLARIEEQTGQLYFTLLDYRTRNPSTSSAQMAEQLAGRLGKPLTPAGVRQTLHRGREKFADLLLDEVARSVESNDLDKIAQELVDLGLLSYCQDALQRRFGKPT